MGWVITATPYRFTPRKETWYLLYRRLGGPQGRSGRVRKISPPAQGFDPRIDQFATSRYTDYATAGGMSSNNTINEPTGSGNR